jgi:alcohol/geraniol dehydrogenase (NADP+)
MKVRALAAVSKGNPIEDFEFETQDLGSHDCLIQVETCGICHSDIHMIDNDWRISKYPLVPGHEVVGRVLEIGKEVTHLKKGDRVGVGWQASACLECEDCLDGNENLCDKNLGTITGRHGGFADHLQIDSRFAFHLPNSLESHIASPLLCAGITVYSALHYAGMKPGGHIGVIGLGGLGHLAVQFAAKMGNKVTVFTTSQDKAEYALNLGASEAIINPTPKDKLKRKLDIILNTTPHNLDWNYYLNQLGSDGTLSFVGVPPKPLELHVGMLLGKRKRIMASPIGGRGIMLEMLRIAGEHEIHPQTEVFSYKDVNQALAKVRDNTIRYRAVLDFRK